LIALVFRFENRLNARAFFLTSIKSPAMKICPQCLPWLLLIFVAANCTCPQMFAQEQSDPVPHDPELRWWRGNLHTHSLWSDGNDFPEMIAEWYRTHDYHFLALSDHNILSEGLRFMKLADIEKRGAADALAKYRSRFGDEWVETRGEPDSSEYAIRLKPLNEFRALLEERGRFILLSSEEISDSVEGKPVHLNATNLQEIIRPVGGQTVREAIENNVRALEEQAAATNREMLLHLNHPNFHYAITAEDIATVFGERFFEVYNGHPGVNHLGDEERPSIEQMWDIANTIRLGQFKEAPLFGLGTDDSHQYHGEKIRNGPGRSWVMVRSRYLTPEYLIRAMKRGDFYASSGVTLKEVAYDPAQKSLQIEVEPDGDASFQIEFIGTKIDYDATTEPRADQDGRPITQKYSADVGMVFETVQGPVAKYAFKGDELYVRAVITSSQPHHDPSFQGQHKQAWTQPVGWDLP
jgi:hypothetical protein